MIKNIVFDFGNVLLGWNEDEIVGYFSDDIKEREILRDVIFKSKEWAGLDDGSLTYEEAKIVFKEKMPKGLK